jgi:hypothetical protein
MNDALNLILSKMTELSGALEGVNNRLLAVETGAREVASTQTAATHAKTKTRAPLPDNVHPTARTPTEPGTKRNPTDNPAICLAAECGETTTTSGSATHYSRALTIHFPRSEHVSRIIGGRSSSSRKETKPQTEDELITQNDAWQTVLLWRSRGASFWLQPKDEPGQAKQPATQTDARTLSVLLADSILWVCKINADDDDARRKLAEQVVTTHYGPAATTTKKGKAKT